MSESSCELPVLPSLPGAGDWLSALPAPPPGDVRPLPMSVAGVPCAWLGGAGCRLCDGRRVHRSSQLCHGHSGSRAGGGRFPGGHAQSAGLAQLRRLAAIRPAEAVLRHQCREHGFDDQPLHGEQESPQRRRLFAGRAHWPAAGSRHTGLLPAGPGSVQRRARHRRRCGGLAAATGPLRLLE